LTAGMIALRLLEGLAGLIGILYEQVRGGRRHRLDDAD